jgi:hypothetical protein
MGLLPSLIFLTSLIASSMEGSTWMFSDQYIGTMEDQVVASWFCVVNCFNSLSDIAFVVRSGENS